MLKNARKLGINSGCPNCMALSRFLCAHWKCNILGSYKEAVTVEPPRSNYKNIRGCYSYLAT